MPHPSIIRFDTCRSASLAEIAAGQDVGIKLSDLGLEPPKPVLILVGGADGLGKVPAQRLKPLFRYTLAPLIDRLSAIVIDGGTDSGIMALMGQARARMNAGFPLLGVTAKGTVCLPGQVPASDLAHSRLEPNHTHFLLVPGDDWGNEAPWISALATGLARGSASATLVAGGGKITRLDIALALRAGRPTILLAGSGGTADLVAEALESGDYAAIGIESERMRLLRVVDLDTAARTLREVLESLLCSPEGSASDNEHISA